MTTWNYGWLFDDDFALTYQGEYREYLDLLRRRLRFFKYSKPIPIKIGWNEKNKQVRVIVTEENIYEDFLVDPHVSVWDFCHKIERVFLKPFFPMYKIERISNRPVDDFELKKLIKNGMKAQDAINQTIEEKTIEEGLIDKIWLKQDTFQLIVNGNKSIRSSAVPGNSMYIMEFLERLKGETDQNKIKDFIFENSIEIIETLNLTKSIEIDYEDETMIFNFFKENIYDLIKTPFREIGNNWWEWGKFDIYFPSKSIRKKCEAFVSEFRKENN